MSGKAYTMKELKGIVEYLTEHKSYGETKARKMWTVYASSGLTHRTWQSLKETFLKRILPDIHNPYYKLSLDEIRSFQSGVDYTSKINNKLEFRTSTKDSSGNDQKVNTQPGTSNKNKGDEDNSGEDNKCSKVSSSRDSVDTVILNTEESYENAQDMAKELENIDENSSQDSVKTHMSLRDCIVYSEPLTPLLQEIVDDFQSEHSDSEPQMVIDEGPLSKQEIINVASSTSECTEIKNNDTKIPDKDEKILIPGKQENEVNDTKAADGSKKKSLRLDKTKNENVALQKQKRSLSEGSRARSTSRTSNEKVTLNEIKKVSITQNIENSDSSSNTSVFETTANGKPTQNPSPFDSLLPNNQEELKKKVNNVSPQLEVTKRNMKNIEENLENKNGTASDDTKKSKANVTRKKKLFESDSDEQKKNLIVKTKKDSVNGTNKHINSKDSHTSFEKEEEKNTKKTQNYNKKEEVNNTELELDKSSNPCLNSVSLYTEPLLSVQMSDSDHSATSKNKKTGMKLAKKKYTINDKKKNQNSVVKTRNIKKGTVSTDEANKTEVNNKDNNLQSDMNSVTKLDMVDEPRDNAINTTSEHNSNKENNQTKNQEKEAIKIGEKNSNDQKIEVILNSQESNFSANPCLQSVSLFAEQFPITEVSDSNSSVKSNSKDANLESAKSAKTVKNKDISDPSKSTSPNKISNNSNINMKMSEIVVLKSHSDSESDEGIQSRNDKNAIPPQYKKKQVLNNLFGNSGGLSRKRARKQSFRNGSVNRHIQRSSSDSSDWTSDSDGEYVSPPRSRSRHCRKFLKPQSSRILSLEQDGGLFVLCGKKIYPLVKDGKVLKNYLTYLSESDNEDKESYWKVKYVEECKRTAELTRLLKHIDDGTAIAANNKCDSPILQSKSSKTTNCLPSSPRKNNETKEINGNELALQSLKKQNVDEKTVKIKFAKDDGQEVFLEGHWQSIHPILSKVMHVFQKEGSSKSSKDQLATPIEIESGNSTPIITQPLDEDKEGETHKKINELENKIFQEIEEIDKAENKDQTTTERRKRSRPQKLSPSPVKMSAKSKRVKTSTESTKSDGEITVSKTKLLPINDHANVTPSRRRTRIQSSFHETHEKANELENKIFQEIEEIDKAENKDQTTTERRKRSRPQKLSPSPVKMSAKSKRVKTSTESTKSDGEITVSKTKLLPINDHANVTPSRRRTRVQSSFHETKPAEARKSNSKALKPNNNVNNADDDSQVLYKFPSPEPEIKRKAGRPKSYSKTNKVPQSNNDKTPKIYSSFDSVLLQSESSQGYQDSDYSPVHNLRKKRMSSLPSYSCRSKSKWCQSRRTSRYFFWDASDESSNSPFKVKSKSVSMKNLTLNSETYRSESYQLLMPHARSFRPMARISEASPCPNEMNSARDLMLSPSSQVVEDRSNGSESINTNVEASHSSNVSLPLSPELSIVENISINKNMLPTINVIQAENESMAMDYDEQYLISKVDVSVPLMSQKCNLKTYANVNENCNRQPGSPKISAVIKNATVSESLLDKMDVVNFEESRTISDSLDMRLENMLLDSAKKITAQNTKNAAFHINLNSVIDGKDIKKRCSTPRKRKSTKLKLPPVDSTIEECMEFCVSGRKSCPPMITTLNDEEQTQCVEIITNQDATSNITNQDATSNITNLDATSNITNLEATSNITKRRPRKPKDVIKVKITKPKEKKKSVKKASKKSSKNISKASILTDSGINDTVLSAVLHDFNDDVDLIHNHSETCLQTNECLSNSVEFIDRSNSVISLNTSSLHFFQNKENIEVRKETRTSITPDMFCTDALDGISLSTNEVLKLSNGPSNSGGASSLITEDLSDEIKVQPRSQWYLLNEEETTNTLADVIKPAECTMKSSYGADLRKIFTEVCTVPNLSTITEMSRENESSSRKSFLQNTNSNTRNDF